MTTEATKVVCAKFPDPKLSEECFRFEKVSLPAIKEGEVLIRNTYLSVDPYIRGRMTAGKSYGATIPLGGVIFGTATGIVAESKNKDWPVGTLLTHYCGWQSHVVYTAEELKKQQKLPPIPVSPHLFLGMLGMPGFTAWYGLKKLGKPKEGETLYVSGAAGAVGLVVGQLGKILGLRVVGSAGSDEKVKFLKELGFDEAINYKNEGFEASLAKACPKGIDIYFENVGGATLDIVLKLANNFGRIVACGMISQYQLKEPERYGVKNLFHIIGKRLTVSGFIISDHWDLMPEAGAEMVAYLKSGQLKERSTIVKGGLPKAPEAFMGLFSGANTGKMIVDLTV